MVASWMAIGRSLLTSGIKRISSGRQSHAEWRFHRSWPRIWPSYMSLASGSLFANKTPSIHKYTSSSYFPQVEVIEVVGFKVGLGGVGLNFHLRTEFYRMTERCSDWVAVNYCEAVEAAGAVDKQLPRSVGSSRVELTMQTPFEDKRADQFDHGWLATWKFIFWNLWTLQYMQILMQPGPMRVCTNAAAERLALLWCNTYSCYCVAYNYSLSQEPHSTLPRHYLYIIVY